VIEISIGIPGFFRKIFGQYLKVNEMITPYRLVKFFVIILSLDFMLDGLAVGLLVIGFPSHVKLTL
jgi:hypothetical protein